MSSVGVGSHQCSVASVGVKLGVKLPMWVCHARSACGDFSVGVA